jgi:hypothetical protein
VVCGGSEWPRGRIEIHETGSSATASRAPALRKFSPK